MKKDKRIDAYIARSADFAKPVLEHIRKLVHQASPDMEETIKWGMPHFDHEGKSVVSMAAFKQHAVFGFWKAELIKDPKNYMQARKAQGGDAMGHGGKLTSVKDLPPDKVFIDFVKQAIRLNQEGVKLPPREKKSVDPKNTTAPDDFAKALKKNKKAWQVWEEWTPGKKKEYVDWIKEAKTDITRNKRIETSVEWISEGKIRNWKYVNK